MRLAIVILLGLVIQVVNGQTKKVEFYGYRLMQYQNPVLIGDGTYNAYYKNLGEAFSKGRFELDESRGTFLIKWENGDDWLARYNKKIITTNQHDLEIGDITQINYSGTWIDEGGECELRVLQTGNNECVIELRTGKAIDTDKGINTWKKVFRFFVRGCFNNLQLNKPNVNIPEERLKIERANFKKAISEKRVFSGEEISEGAKFIGNPSDLLQFYKNTPVNAFTVSLLIDESGNYKFQDIGRGYIALSSIDTIALRKALRFMPAKKVLASDTFLVRSAIVLSFAQRNGDGIHYSPIYSTTGVIKKKNNSIEVSLEPSDRKQLIIERINSSNSFSNKKPGTYQVKMEAIKLNVDIFIYDVQGRYCHSEITNRSEIVKNIVEFYGQGESWQIAY